MSQTNKQTHTKKGGLAGYISQSLTCIWLEFYSQHGMVLILTNNRTQEIPHFLARVLKLLGLHDQKWLCPYALNGNDIPTTTPREGRSRIGKGGHRAKWMTLKLKAENQIKRIKDTTHPSTQCLCGKSRIITCDLL